MTNLVFHLFIFDYKNNPEFREIYFLYNYLIFYKAFKSSGFS